MSDICGQVDAVWIGSDIGRWVAQLLALPSPRQAVDVSLWQRLGSELGWQGLPLLVLLALVLFLSACNGLCMQRPLFVSPELMQRLQQLRLRDGLPRSIALVAREESCALARLLARCLPFATATMPVGVSGLQAEQQVFWESELRPHLWRCRGLRFCAEGAPVVALLCLLNPWAKSVAGMGEWHDAGLSHAQPYLVVALAIALVAMALAHYFEHRLAGLVAETQLQAHSLLFGGCLPAALEKSEVATAMWRPRWQKNRNLLAWLMLLTLAGWTSAQPSRVTVPTRAARTQLRLESDGVWRDACGQVQQPISMMLQSPQAPEQIELLVPASGSTGRADPALDAVLQQARFLGWRVQLPDPRIISP